MKKILLVEDDKFLVRVYRSKLESSGYQVMFLEDGERVLPTIIAQKPDLIVLDLAMPKKDGFSVLQELKNNPDAKNIPVIVLSVLEMDEDMRKGLSLGAVEYLGKTKFAFSEVVAVIKKHI